jgi:preprotein translocase subunit SecA
MKAQIESNQERQAVIDEDKISTSGEPAAPKKKSAPSRPRRK